MSNDTNPEEDIQKIIENLDMNSDASKEGALEADADKLVRVLQDKGLDPDELGNRDTIALMSNFLAEKFAKHIYMLTKVSKKMKAFSILCEGECADHVEEAGEQIQKLVFEDGINRFEKVRNHIKKALEKEE